MLYKNTQNDLALPENTAIQSKNKYNKKDRRRISRPSVFLKLSIKSCGEPYKHVVIIGLRALKGCLVANDAAASVTAVYDDISFFRVGQGLYGAENSTAIVSSVSRVYIHVERAEAEGAMVPRAIA